MRKVLVSIAALGAALSAAPAMAQSWGNPGGGYGQPGYGNGYDQRGHDQRGYDNDRRQGTSVEQVRFAVERAIRSGRVPGREARALRNAVDDLQRRAYRAQRDGYSWGERRDIDNRAREILQRLQYSNGNYGGNDNGYGRDRDRDGRYDR
jgi:hypothetical protein